MGGVPDSGMVAAVEGGLCPPPPAKSLWLKTLGGSEADRSSLGEASAPAAVIVDCLGLPLAGSCVVFLGDPLLTGCFLWPMCTTLMGTASVLSLLSALDLGCCW